MKRYIKKTNKNKIKGTTLIEILIAVTLLAFICLGIYRMTAQGFDIREKVELEGDFYNSVRTGFDQFERDILMIYSPPQPKQADGGVENKPEENPESDIRKEEEDRATIFWGLLQKNGVRVSRFQGAQDRISFIASSHIRIYENNESDLIKVMYTLKADSPEDGIPNTSLLLKTVLTNIYAKEETPENAITYPVLFGIREFQFSYYDRMKDTWLKEWDSASSEIPNAFPDVIRIKATIVGKNERINTTIIKRYFRPLLPLNAARRIVDEVQNPTHFND